jgi:hypothetical protein
MHTNNSTLSWTSLNLVFGLELQGKKFLGDQWSAAHFQEVGEAL